MTELVENLRSAKAHEKGGIVWNDRSRVECEMCICDMKIRMQMTWQKKGGSVNASRQ